MDTFDLIVIGAGWYGLAAAKTYLQLHPSARLTILDSASSLGGTWSISRLYPGLHSNNLVGSYEYPDFPMKEEIYGVKENQHIPAGTLHRYLSDYARLFGILEKIRFGVRVESVEQEISGSWLISTKSGETSDVQTVRTEKFIVATGLTSTPNMPQYANEESFAAPLFHTKEFSEKARLLETAKNVVVVGAAKSAYDIAHAMVEQGSTVDLIIRPNGHGPVWIAPAFVTPFRKRLDALLNVRWMSWMSPCPWGGEDGYPGLRRFLHGTLVGRWIVDAFWKVLGGEVVSRNGYDGHPELKKLKPWNSAFWIGSGLSILNYERDLFGMVREGKVRVHVDNIDHLEPKKVVLSGGTILDADAMICATGWKKESGLKWSGLGEEGCGLPYTEAEKVELAKEADEKILAMFPRLANQPDLPFEQKTSDPLRMYRFIVPPTFVAKRTLAFAGMVSCVSTASCAHNTGLWISAFFDGKLERIARSQQEITDEVMLHTQWGKWRYPSGYGASLPDFVFDGVPYFDLLLRDLGLETHRQKNFWRELTSPYYPKLYDGLVEEWQAKQENKRMLERSNGLK